MRKDFKLRFNGEGYKPLFYVNKEKGIVSCKLEACLLTPYSYDIFIPETRLLRSLINCSPSAHALGNLSAVQPAVLKSHITLYFSAHN